jgi:hypothetical protein
LDGPAELKGNATWKNQDFELNAAIGNLQRFLDSEGLPADAGSII